METFKVKENNREHLREQWIKILTHLRDDYSNELPLEDIHEGFFKVRRNWWHQFLGHMTMIIKEFGDTIDPSIEKETNELYAHFQEKLDKVSEAMNNGIKSDAHKTTREEIVLGNNLLEKAIENLKR